MDYAQSSQASPGAAVVENGLRVIRRNGHATRFDPSKIAIAITKAFLATEGNSGAASTRVREIVAGLTDQVIAALTRRLPGGGTVHIEDIQDQVELALMRNGHHETARRYVLYREQRAQARASAQAAAQEPEIHVRTADGRSVPLDRARLKAVIDEACSGLREVSADGVLQALLRNLFDGVDERDVMQSAILSARALVETEPNYTYVSARLLLDVLRREVLGRSVTHGEMRGEYAEYFQAFIREGVEAELIDPRLTEFDGARLGQALKADRDLNFTYLGLQTLYDRYFLHREERRIELPQAFWMRVAMGLALNEVDRETRAIEFYEALSTFDFVSSTPTLFNAGTLRSQLSSCYLTTVSDDLDGIYSAIKDNALLSKYAGGLGNDWSRVRALGARIKGTNGKSQGVIPFLKVANDTAVAVNQGGRRKGAVCAYLETWHLDIEEFLELRKNTGDDRRRTHDMNTANWIPDLFMERVRAGAEWTLFSPSDTADLHDVYGEAFRAAYERHEEQVARGELKLFKKVRALDLWRKMLSMLFETGHPWLTFKDPCNLRSPQRHRGVVHSSNLCCMTADQRVVTDRGLLTVGELYALGGKNRVVGLDGVYDASEMLRPRPNAPIVRIETAEGYRHKVTPDHKVWVKDRGWVEARHLKPGDRLLVQQREGLFGPMHNPEIAFVIGLMTASSAYGRHRMVTELEATRFAYIGKARMAVISHETGETHEPWHETHDERDHTHVGIPELIWKGDKETVTAYLRGLYQAGNGMIKSLTLASYDQPFIESLQIVWANLGVETHIQQIDKAYWRHSLFRLIMSSSEGHAIAASVLQVGEEDFPLNHGDSPHVSDKQRGYATFTGLTPLPKEDAYCLMVDSPTHAWTVNGLITKNTEITLNTSDQEIAVCNLGSVNLAAHVGDEGGMDMAKLGRTVRTAMRMLDNVIDVNYYSVPQARASNLRHRPVGLGLMGFQDALYKLRLPYGSDEAMTFADRSMEAVSFYAILASSELAKERGTYASYEGSLWSQGILPIDSIAFVEEARGGSLSMDRGVALDWTPVRETIAQHGMRNSNCLAIAPTATISNIAGVAQSIEPTYQNLFVKSNLSGEFTVLNEHLVRDLKERGLWDPVMVNDLKYYNGRVRGIDRLPDDLKALYATAFEIEPRWLIEAASRRQKWIDQAQSLNLYMAEPSGRKLSDMYMLAWEKGLKTTYYLRTLGATSVEKSTLNDGALNAVRGAVPEAPKACAINDPQCEACQ
ncbi:MAG: ribonucleoside-diphosphate reductase subunit alpha [Gammaproteobacteria bacterium]|nr:ribonucleoside-diphosphate reductase subunit alpha [Gammaproteobacteria bacterium]